MQEVDTIAGPATFQRMLWSASSQNWADYQEPLLRTLYAAILDRAGSLSGATLLDIGCGAGLFLAMAAERGAVVSGLDITPDFIAIAKSRLPGSDLRVGDMESLPYENERFDLVTGLSVFQFASDPVRALAEARRVTKPSGTVVAAVFGTPQDCDIAIALGAFEPLMPSVPPGIPGPFTLSADGVLSRVATAAGLEPIEVIDLEQPFDLADDDAALRCLLANGPAAIAIRTSGMERVREALLRAIAPFRMSDGGYHLECKFHCLTARRRESVL